MIPCDELARTWSDRWPRPDPETNRHHRRMVRGFGEHFGERSPDSVSREEAHSWALENPGRARYVRAMLNDALDVGLIDSNPFANMRLPEVPEEEIVVPTQKQLVALRAQAPLALSAMIDVAAHTGLRQGELRALAIDDLQEDFARADVNWQITRDGRLKRPKKNSRGRILLPGNIQPSSLHGPVSLVKADSPLRPFRLFPISRDQLSRQWTRTREDAGVDIRWHDLRHYCATWMLNCGATVDDVARQLRCDVDLIRRRYGHADPELALQRLERLVDGP